MRAGIKKFFNWQIALGAALITLSTVFYLVHYAVFRDAHHIFLYLIGDIAFVFIEVLLVTIIIHELLTQREKQAKLKKLNMVIGAFFSEAGTDLLRLFAGFDKHAIKLGQDLIIADNWDPRQFHKIEHKLKKHDFEIDTRHIGLEILKKTLLEKREFLLRLLENPNLLEHESFTNLLWAIFHLTDELANRKDVLHLGSWDLEHLANDIKRAYTQLLAEWLRYLSHLKKEYPFLFSLALRTNPFDAAASIEIKE